MLWALVIILTAGTVYWLIKSRRNYWTRKGVKQNPNGFILGDNWGVLLRKQTIIEMMETAYRAHPKTRYSGFYQFLSPALIIRDPELIKQVAVKDFDHFVNHMGMVPEDGDNLFSRNLFQLKNKKWRDMRSTMSPAFTSSKIKFMFSLVCQNSEQFVNHFLKKKEEVVTLELKDAFTRFTNDVIASIVFGVEIDSLENPNNEFYLIGKDLTDFGRIGKIVRFFGFYLVPYLYKVFKISPFSKKEVDFFANLVRNNMKSRQDHAIVRPDLMTILLQAQKDGLDHDESPKADTGFATVEESEVTKSSKTKTKITNDDIVAQAIAFFFAGFETVAGLLCFMAYELGVNPDVQQKLIQEVDKTLEACGGKLTYEALFGMKYMDMVVSEALRKWPNVVTTDRVCTKPYTIEPKYPDEEPVHLEEGSIIWIPIIGLQKDSKYYPDPERFDPERFSDENKENVKPYTYLPFGVGPRNCIGSRLGLMEVKALFFHLLARFEIVPVGKTQIPVKISKKHINLQAEGGFWFGFKRRVDIST